MTKLTLDSHASLLYTISALYIMAPDNEDLLRKINAPEIDFPLTILEAYQLNLFISTLNLKEFGDFVKDIGSSENLDEEDNPPIKKWIERNPICVVFNRPEVMDFLWEGWRGCPM